MDKLQKMLKGLDLRTMTGVEIGALTSPLVGRADGEIIYVDHADTETLRRKYAADANVDVSRIVEVDAVWGSNTLQQAIGEGRKADYVIASHVVEHVPDLLSWLAEIQGVLRPTGTLRLAVPDRRFTFDFLRQETRLSDILNARLAAARAPLPAQILDCVS
jgi:SAM-dependent methyltransferase